MYSSERLLDQKAEDDTRPAGVLPLALPPCPSPYVSHGVICATLSGCVYLAKHNVSDDDRVVVKVVREARSLRDTQDLEMEALIHHRLHHPNIVRFIAYGTDTVANTRFLACEYVAGGDLFAYVEQQALTTTLCAKFFTQILSAVQYMHSKGVAHLDLSLENMVVDTANKTVKLCDFGLARVQTAVAQSRDEHSAPDGLCVRRPAPWTAVGGKRCYLAPELYTLCRTMTVPPDHNKRRRASQLPAFSHLVGAPAHLVPEEIAVSGVDGKAADVFALGVVLFLLLTGVSPWHAPNVDTDMRYRWVVNGKLDALLRHWQLTLPCSVETCSLLTGMWSPCPSDRPTVETVQQRWVPIHHHVMATAAAAVLTEGL